MIHLGEYIKMEYSGTKRLILRGHRIQRVEYKIDMPEPRVYEDVSGPVVMPSYWEPIWNTK